jgi:hypothetical protein
VKSRVKQRPNYFMKTKSSVGKTVASLVAGGALAASLYANVVYVPQQERSLEENLQSELASLIAGDSELVSTEGGFTVTEAEKAAAAVVAEEQSVQLTDVEDVEVFASVEIEGAPLSAYSDAVTVVAQAVDQDGNPIVGGGTPVVGPGVLGFGANFGIGSIGSIMSSPLANIGAPGGGLPDVGQALGSIGVGAPAAGAPGTGGVGQGTGTSSTTGDAAGAGAGTAGAAASGGAASGASSGAVSPINP